MGVPNRATTLDRRNLLDLASGNRFSTGDILELTWSFVATLETCVNAQPRSGDEAREFGICFRS